MNFADIYGMIHTKTSYYYYFLKSWPIHPYVLIVSWIHSLNRIKPVDQSGPTVDWQWPSWIDLYCWSKGTHCYRQRGEICWVSWAHHINGLDAWIVGVLNTSLAKHIHLKFVRQLQMRLLWKVTAHNCILIQTLQTMYV